MATTIKRSDKSIQQAIIEGLPDVPILESVMEWRLISEQELAASESPEGTLISQGTAQWTINRRSVPAGIYQVKFTASIKIGDPASSQTLNAFNYGFIEVIAAPVRTIIDGGSSVRWGSNEIITVDGSLSYDGDIGPGNNTGLNFSWSCHDSPDNLSLSDDCFGSFVGEATLTLISIDPKQLRTKSYVLRLTVSKADRSHFAEMFFEIADGEIPQVSLRYVAIYNKLFIPFSTLINITISSIKPIHHPR